MALQAPFFGKRENESLGSRPVGTSGQSVLGSSTTGASSLNPATAAVAPAATSTSAQQPATKESGGSKLTVGPNIKLKGVEITDCDTLVVEGTVEATMDSRLMQIAEMGAFNGSAEIDIAEIHGSFAGDLTVRDKLVIYATGRVTGKIRYGKVVIEEGGQLSGEISFGTSSGAAKQISTKAPLQAIA